MDKLNQIEFNYDFSKSWVAPPYQATVQLSTTFRAVGVRHFDE